MNYDKFKIGDKVAINFQQNTSMEWRAKIKFHPPGNHVDEIRGHFQTSLGGSLERYVYLKDWVIGYFDGSDGHTLDGKEMPFHISNLNTSNPRIFRKNPR